jgi:hypothetical protein
MGVDPSAPRGTQAANLADRTTIAYPRVIAAIRNRLIYLPGFMQVNRQTLFVSLIAGLAVVCSCAVLVVVISQSLPVSQLPGGGVPVAAEPTEPVASMLPTSGPAFTPRPGLPERRRLTLEFPTQIRTGDADLVRLTLEVDDLGAITPTAEIKGNVITGETIEIPNLYETHNVTAEARLDMAGMEVSPPGLAGQTLSPGQSITFYWSIRPAETGIYRGTVWLFLRFIDRQSGDEIQKAVSAQRLEIEAVNLAGLSGNVARITGLLGSVIGTVIGFPFLEDIVRLLIKKRKTGKWRK